MIHALQQPTGNTTFKLKYGSEEYCRLYANVPGLMNSRPVATFMKTMDKGLIIAASRTIAESYKASLTIEADFYED